MSNAKENTLWLVLNIISRLIILPYRKDKSGFLPMWQIQDIYNRMTQ